jgi:hypothetical protein
MAAAPGFFPQPPKRVAARILVFAIKRSKFGQQAG